MLLISPQIYHYDCGIIRSRNRLYYALIHWPLVTLYGDIELGYMGSGNALLSVAPLTNMD